MNSKYSFPMELNGNWKGGRVLRGRPPHDYWYIKQPDHPNATKQGYVAEHRLVMESKIGRILKRREVVHHIDGDIKNNDPDNLELFASHSEHRKVELGRLSNETRKAITRAANEAYRKNLALRRSRERVQT